MQVEVVSLVVTRFEFDIATIILLGGNSKNARRGSHTNSQESRTKAK